MKVILEKLKMKQLSIELKKEIAVISLGGGAFLNKLIRKVKESSVSFWLDVNIFELTKRLNKIKKRPLLLKKNLKDTINKIYLERKKIYSQSDFRIKCDFLNQRRYCE